jgi:hypothetical protein
VCAVSAPAAELALSVDRHRREKTRLLAMKQSIALPTSSITDLSSASDSLDPVVVALVDEATAAGDTIGYRINRLA